MLLNGVRVVFWRAKQKDPARRAGFVASLCCRSPGRTEGRRGEKKKKTRRDNIQTHLVLVCRSLDRGGSAAGALTGHAAWKMASERLGEVLERFGVE